MGAAGAGRDWGRRAQVREGCLGPEPVGVVPGGDQELGRGLGADSGQRDQLGGGLGDQWLELGVGVGDLLGEVLVAAGQAPQCDPDRVGRVVGVRARPGAGQLSDQPAGGKAPQLLADLSGRGDDEVADLVDGLSEGLDG